MDGLIFHDLRQDMISRLFEKGMSVPQETGISSHQVYSSLARCVHLQSQFGLTRNKPMPRGRENTCESICGSRIDAQDVILKKLAKRVFFA